MNNTDIIMKKNLFLAIMCIAFATLCSCGSKSSSSEESKVTAGDYKKACELKEFSTAYEIVDKLKKEEGENVSDKAEKYVVLQEALFVLESKGTDGIMRIVGIAKEHNAEGWLYLELLDVAKKMGDTDLANRFESIIQSTINNLSNLSLSDISLINFLAETKDEKNSETIIGLLAKEEKNIPTKPMMGKIDTKDGWYANDVCDPYTKAVKKYNAQCSMILNIAIQHGNQYLANRSISKIKTNIKYVKLPNTYRNGWVYHYNITNDDEDIKSAKAAYQDAVSSGAFK